MSLAACETADTGSDGDITIGADLELTGSAAAIGKAYNDALRLKVDQLNASGATGNRKIKLVIRDNRSDTSLSQKNIAEFADDSRVAAAITGSCSDCLNKVSKTINDRGLPTVALAPSTLATGSAPFLFKVAPNAKDGAATLVGEFQRTGIKKVGLLVVDDPYGRNGESALRKEFTNAKIKLTGVQQVKTTDIDVGAAMAALIEKKPTAIVVWTFAEQAGLAAIAAKAAKFKGRLFFDSAAAGELFLGGQAAAAAEGVTMPFTQTMVIDDVIATTPAKAARKQWFRDYTARYGSYAGFASFAADALQLIADALTRMEKIDRARLRELLETSRLDGLSGPIRITPANHSGLMPQALMMLVVRRGRWRLAS